MANLEILTIPDPVLRRKSAPVERIDDATRRFMDEMLKTMYDAPGIGLAAIQVGEPRRIITIDVAREEEAKSPLFLVNPEIVWTLRGRALELRGGLPLHPRLLCRGRAAGEGAGALSRL